MVSVVSYDVLEQPQHTLLKTYIFARVELPGQRRVGVRWLQLS